MNAPHPNNPENDPGRKLFSLEEANSLVPVFREIFIEINSLKQAIITVMDSKISNSKSNGHLVTESKEVEQDMEMVTTAAERITELADQINRSGAELKDLDLGLVDFLHRRKGRIVYLCWMFGEDEIGFWHELDAGSAGRKPL